MARLKVFASRQGFYDTVVAAPSQKAALDAWGAHQDLFGQQAARVETDAAAVHAALARPGEVLQRPAGSDHAFVPAADAPLPKAPKIVPPVRAARKAGSKGRAGKPPKAPPNRSNLTAAEEKLAEAEARRSAEQAKIDRDRAALDTREFDLTRTADAEHKALQREIDKAQRAYQRAGGRD